MDRLLIALLMYSDRGDDDDTERKTPMDNVKPSTGNFEHWLTIWRKWNKLDL